VAEPKGCPAGEGLQLAAQLEAMVFDGCKKAHRGEKSVEQVIPATSTHLDAKPAGANSREISTRCCKGSGSSLQCKSRPGTSRSGRFTRNTCLPRGFPFEVSKDACEDIGEGWSLCTKDQLLTGKCCGSGCQYDHHYTWTLDITPTEGCTTCQPGWFSTDNSDSCEMCPGGQYAASQQQCVGLGDWAAFAVVDRDGDGYADPRGGIFQGWSRMQSKAYRSGLDIPCGREHFWDADLPDSDDATAMVFDGCKKSGENSVEQEVNVGSKQLASKPPGATGKAIATRCCNAQGKLQCKSQQGSRKGKGCYPLSSDYATSASACEDIGAGWHLCTKEQLLTNKCCGTGCDYDQHYTWTFDKTISSSCEYAMCPRGAFAATEATCQGDSCVFPSANQPGWWPSSCPCIAAAGATGCVVCPAGKFAVAGSSVCEECPAGKFSLAEAEACTECVEGKVSPASSDSCTECLAGQFAQVNDEQLGIKCKDCDAGYYSGRNGELGCEACAAGHYNKGNGWSSCDQCEAGRSAAAAQAPACNECSAGHYAAATAMAQCEACTGGYYQAHAARSSCTQCQGGQYSSSSAIKCETCAVGKHTVQTAGSPEGLCLDCSAGKYADKSISPSAGANRCTNCESGRYNDQSGLQENSCKACGVGKYTSSAGKQACASCAAGKYTEGEGQATCKTCSSGTKPTADQGGCTDNECTCNNGVAAGGGHLYKGCFKDDNGRDLKGGPGGSNYAPGTCRDACKDYTYFALQNGGKCYCDNTYSTPASQYPSVPSGECNTGGAGYGGLLRNAVYQHPANGIAGDCPTDGAAKCISCGSGYELVGDKCEALVSALARRRTIFSLKGGRKGKWCQARSSGIRCSGTRTRFEMGAWPESGNDGTYVWIKNKDDNKYCADQINKITCSTTIQPTDDEDYKFRMIDDTFPSQDLTKGRANRLGSRRRSEVKIAIQGGNGAANKNGRRRNDANLRRRGTPADWRHASCADESNRIRCNRPWVAGWERFSLCDEDGNC